jgi:hypothetical protein
MIEYEITGILKMSDLKQSAWVVKKGKTLNIIYFVNETINADHSCSYSLDRLDGSKEIRLDHNNVSDYFLAIRKKL